MSYCRKYFIDYLTILFGAFCEMLNAETRRGVYIVFGRVCVTKAGQQHKQRDDQMCFKELGIQTDKPHGIVQKRLWVKIILSERKIRPCERMKAPEKYSDSVR